jgi:TPR repeat protein
MYLKGEGGEQDDGSAYVYFSLAAAQDYPKAAKLRDKAGKKLSKEQRVEADELISAALGGQ